MDYVKSEFGRKVHVSESHCNDTLCGLMHYLSSNFGTTWQICPEGTFVEAEVCLSCKKKLESIGLKWYDLSPAKTRTITGELNVASIQVEISVVIVIGERTIDLTFDEFRALSSFFGALSGIGNE